MSKWTCAGDHITGLDGNGVYLVANSDVPMIGTALEEVRYHVVTIDGLLIQDKQSALSAITKALDVPTATNYDAFTDVLDNVRSPLASQRVALLWRNGQNLLNNDLPAWTTVTNILHEAYVSLWNLDTDDAPDNTVFETIIGVDGHGVVPVIES